MRRQRRSRRGFTLLEVVIATAVAAILVGALYVAVDLQLRSAQMSRDTIQDSTLERAVMARMDADAAQVVGLSDPARYRFQAGLDTAQPATTTGGMNSGAGNTANSGATGAGSNTANTSNTSATNGSTGTASPSTTTGANGSTGAASSFGSATAVTNSSGVTNIVLPLGVMGDSQTLHLFVSNLPREIFSSSGAFANAAAGNAPPVGDVRRVSYWLVGGDGDQAAGLARQEVSVSTSDDALENLPPGVDYESSLILSDEVRSLQFQYWDGNEWQDSWDSTELGPDGVTPIGSPLAVAVTIGFAPKSSGPGQPEPPLHTVRHVLVIPSANGLTVQSESASGVSTQSTTSSSTTNTNSTTNGGGASP